jgi:UDP:flavonoid glycosyltransferase YjiC (YdhE family)
MSNLLYAWELGAHMGHMGSFLPLARCLRTRGHQVSWAVAKTADAARLLPPEGFAWLQAPGLPDQRPGHLPESYAAILLHYGYAHAEKLLGLVVAWRELMRLSGAQLVLADHAPTAILAARTLGLPVMLHGAGFSVPAPVHPCPALRPDAQVPEAQRLQIDSLALRSINHVLGLFACPPIDRVCDLFQVQEQGLLTFPELDPWPGRGPTRYWGSLSVSTGVAPDWPLVPGARVFAYLRGDAALVESTLAALAALDTPVLVYLPGLSEATRASFESPRLRFAPAPVDLHQVAAQAALGVLVGGGGTSALAFLQAGTPLLMLPAQLETYLLGLKIQALGAGLVCAAAPSIDLPAMLRRVLVEPGFSAQAGAFARRHAGSTAQHTIDQMVARMEAIVAPAQA